MHAGCAEAAAAGAGATCHPHSHVCELVETGGGRIAPAGGVPLS